MQPETTESVASAANAAIGSNGMILEMLTKGGGFMWVILIVALVTLAIVTERMIRIYIVYYTAGENLMKQITKHIMGENIDRAIVVCDTSPRAAVAQVLKAGLTKANKSEVDIQNSIEEKTLEVIPRVQTRLHYLPMLANLATLLGLLGTVVGLIQAFTAMKVADPVQKQEVLTGGISVAMYTTAFGLIVAIPTLFMHSILNSRVVAIINDIDEFSVKLINLLVARSRAFTRRPNE